MRGERRHVIGGLEQHAGEVVGQQLDLLVRMVDGHVVHALELRHRCAHQIQARRASLDAGLRIAFVGGGERLEALPVGQVAQRRVGGQQVVQVGGAGAGQPADDDRPLDRRRPRSRDARRSAPRSRSRLTRLRPVARRRWPLPTSDRSGLLAQRRRTGRRAAPGRPGHPSRRVRCARQPWRAGHRGSARAPRRRRPAPSRIGAAASGYTGSARSVNRSAQAAGPRSHRRHRRTARPRRPPGRSAVSVSPRAGTSAARSVPCDRPAVDTQLGWPGSRVADHDLATTRRARR